MTKQTTSSSAPAIFSFESTAIRTFSDDYGNPIFCASDVCDVLGYVNGRQAVQKNCHQDGVSTRDIIDSMGRTQQITVITEGNLYRLLVKSRKEEAVRFEKWLMEELLPTIRKTGRYQMPDSPTTSPVIAITAQKGRYLVEVDAEQRCKVISRIADDSVIISRATAKTVMEVISMASSMLTSANSELHQQLDNQLHIRA